MTVTRRKIKAEGFLARILQHEIDHLNGILFVERLEKVYVAKDQASQIEEAANEAAEETKTSMTTSV